MTLSVLMSRLLRHQGCVARRNKANLLSCSTRASARGATSSRPSQWVRRAFLVRSSLCKLFLETDVATVWSVVVVVRPVMYGLALSVEQVVEEALPTLLADTKTSL